MAQADLDVLLMCEQYDISASVPSPVEGWRLSLSAPRDYPFGLWSIDEDTGEVRPADQHDLFALPELLDALEVEQARVLCRLREATARVNEFLAMFRE